MITKKIQALFDFIDFLHSNIELCLSQNRLFGELHELHKERNELRPIDNYKKKLSYDNIQTELQTKFSTLEQSIIKPIINKTYELQICDYNETTSLWNWNIAEIANMRNTFDEKDISVIKEYKQKYIEFRNTPNSECYQSLFFSYLDEILKELFDFFKDNSKNEFETFEAKTINANSFEDAIKLAIENKNARISINNFFQNDTGDNKMLPKQQNETEQELKKINKEEKDDVERPFAEAIPDLGEHAVLSLKVLHLTFDNYFYVWMPKEVSIDEEIERNKELQETKIVTTLEAAKKAGKITTIIYNAQKITLENFDILYAVKLKEYLEKVDYSIENDFIEDELKKCKLWIDKIPEKKLMKRWVEFLGNKLSKTNSVDLIHEKSNLQQLPQKNDSNENLIKSLIEKTELYSFLSVPAPDILHENAFWHDENNEPIDCNIYHPKYGYAGFETTTKETIVTSFNPVTIYRDSKTGKYIYCRYDLQMLCIEDEKNFTNKDGKKVIKVDYLQTHNTRLAESEQDLELIYKFEFESRKLTDTIEARKVFNQELINHINDLIGLHKERSTYKDRDINTLSLADRFIAYLNNLKNEPKNESLDTLQSNIKPTVSAYALMHVYLEMHGGQAVTQQNKNELAKRLGFSNGNQLRNEFTKFKNEVHRLDLSTTNKHSANTHLERYKQILPLLEKENKDSFEAAKKDLEKLNAKYEKHY